MKRKPTDLVFKISHQYNLFLQRGKLDASKMSPIQYNEMKKAFFAAWAQFYRLTSDQFAELTLDETVQVMENFETELKEFWTEQVKDYNEGKINYQPQMVVFCNCGWTGPVYELTKPTDKENNKCTCPKCGSDYLNIRK